MRAPPIGIGSVAVLRGRRARVVKRKVVAELVAVHAGRAAGLHPRLLAGHVGQARPAAGRVARRHVVDALVLRRIEPGGLGGGVGGVRPGGVVAAAGAREVDRVRADRPAREADQPARRLPVVVVDGRAAAAEQPALDVGRGAGEHLVAEVDEDRQGRLVTLHDIAGGDHGARASRSAGGLELHLLPVEYEEMVAHPHRLEHRPLAGHAVQLPLGGKAVGEVDLQRRCRSCIAVQLERRARSAVDEIIGDVTDHGSLHTHFLLDERRRLLGQPGAKRPRQHPRGGYRRVLLQQQDHLGLALLRELGQLGHAGCALGRRAPLPADEGGEQTIVGSDQLLIGRDGLADVARGRGRREHQAEAGAGDRDRDAKPARPRLASIHVSLPVALRRRELPAHGVRAVDVRLTDGTRPSRRLRHHCDGLERNFVTRSYGT